MPLAWKWKLQPLLAPCRMPPDSSGRLMHDAAAEKYALALTGRLLTRRLVVRAARLRESECEVEKKRVWTQCVS